MPHSNGPWTFEKKGNRHLNSGYGESLMCDEQYYPWCPEKDADWQLIAAAPEMLQALEVIAELDPPAPFAPSDGRYKEWFAAWGKLQSAIAKAKGLSTAQTSAKS